jgi:hypothetical protein
MNDGHAIARLCRLAVVANTLVVRSTLQSRLLSASAISGRDCDFGLAISTPVEILS